MTISSSECSEKVIVCLLESVRDLDDDVFLSVSNSVLQLANINFAQVVRTVFTYLEQTRTSQGHMVRLLRILQKVIDSRNNRCHDGGAVGSEEAPNRQSSDMSSVAMSIDVEFANRIIDYVVREVAFIKGDDERLLAMSDVLVELASLQPNQVIDRILSGLDGGPEGFTSSHPPPVVLVRTLAELGVTFPLLLGHRLHEIMARLLSMLSSAAKVDNLRVALGKALSSACIALAFTTDALATASEKDVPPPPMNTKYAASDLHDFSFSAMRLRQAMVGHQPHQPATSSTLFFF